MHWENPSKTICCTWSIPSWSSINPCGVTWYFFTRGVSDSFHLGTSLNEILGKLRSRKENNIHLGHTGAWGRRPGGSGFYLSGGDKLRTSGVGRGDQKTKKLSAAGKFFFIFLLSNANIEKKFRLRQPGEGSKSSRVHKGKLHGGRGLWTVRGEEISTPTPLYPTPTPTYDLGLSMFVLGLTILKSILQKYNINYKKSSKVLSSPYWTWKTVL